jgi:hypothetical protein
MAFNDILSKDLMHITFVSGLASHLETRLSE